MELKTATLVYRLVYRLEHTETGAGVYDFTSGVVEFDNIRHPLPHTDTKLQSSLYNKEIYVFYGHHFGFSSIDQLRAWFYNDDWLYKLSLKGVVLSVYAAKEYYGGNSQCVFKKATATLLGKHDLVEYFHLAPPKEVPGELS